MDVTFVISLTMTMITTLIARGEDVGNVFTQEMPDTCLSGRHHKVSNCFSEIYSGLVIIWLGYIVFTFKLQSKNKTRTDTNTYWLQIGSKSVTTFGMNLVKLSRPHFVTFQKDLNVSEYIECTRTIAMTSCKTKFTRFFWKVKLFRIKICKKQIQHLRSFDFSSCILVFLTCILCTR